MLLQLVQMVRWKHKPIIYTSPPEQQVLLGEGQPQDAVEEAAHVAHVLGSARRRAAGAVLLWFVQGKG